ncbi:heavy-metal-associated domain-containing protein [Palleronia sp.]|uniref:heavy-metal-associated domain-containing protein n=1 Tax=Palleronia sp. TaxID=1940284 RepID=UPI0035C7C924
MDFEVEGMTCGHCERAVTRAVHSVDPAAKVTVDRSAGRATSTRPRATPKKLFGMR